MRKGFTLIELMIVIAIIAIIAAIAIPNLLESRLTANESAAASTLKSGIAAAQVTYMGGAYTDNDGDNSGEAGTLEAMAGLIDVGQTNIAAGTLTMLQGALAAGASGEPTRSSSGYTFISYAPNHTVIATGVTAAGWLEGQPEPGLVPANHNANNGERYWVSACMPDVYGDTGRRAFVLGQDGQVRSPTVASGEISAFYGGAAPVQGAPASDADLLNGIAVNYGVAAWDITVLDGAQPVWPVYTK